MPPLKLTDLFTLILVLARWIIAIQLTRVAHREKLPNLYWLAAFFYITGTGDIYFTFQSVIGLGLKPFGFAVGLGKIALAMFIQQTFYRRRWLTFIVFAGIGLFFLIENTFYAVFPYYSPFNWLWLIWTAVAVYRHMARDRAVEDWVKMRYRLIITYSIFALAGPIFSTLAFIGTFNPALATWLYSGPVILVAQFAILIPTAIGIGIEYLAWVMPEDYRRYINRNYQSPNHAGVMNMSEEEVMRQFQAHGKPTR